MRGLSAMGVIASLGFLLNACALEPQVSEAPAPAHAEPVDISRFETLDGHWKLVAHMTNDCPADHQRALPLGESAWDFSAGKLTIKDVTGVETSVSLHPMDAHTAVADMGVEFMGCSGREVLTLVVDEVGLWSARGYYVAARFHDGSDACVALAQQEQLPERCELTMHWQAQRVQ